MIESGDTTRGNTEGSMWARQFEDTLVPPKPVVLGVNPRDEATLDQPKP
jgi:hypothetical protein